MRVSSRVSGTLIPRRAGLTDGNRAALRATEGSLDHGYGSSALWAFPGQARLALRTFPSGTTPVHPLGTARNLL